MRALLLAAWLVGCGFKEAGTAGDLSGADLGGAPACRTLPLPCLDPGAVIDVPVATTVQDAFMQAKSGDIIQIRRLSLGAGFRVPSGVTLHGCEGAQITDTIAFEGSLGTIEGFVVPGAIIANRTGTYVIRANRFVKGGSSTLAGVSARANEGVVAATVTATVEGNYFLLRDYGVQGLTAYDTLVHTVNLTVRNNIFYGNGQAAVSLTESGLVGQINAQISFNDFISVARGVEMTSVTATTPIRASIFYLGGDGVVSDSPYSISDVYEWAVRPVMGAAPQSGTFINRDPMFGDWGNSDLHLLPGSELIDRVPMGPDVPADDYFGCPRPIGGGADVGAIENQQ